MLMGVLLWKLVWIWVSAIIPTVVKRVVAANVLRVGLVTQVDGVQEDPCCSVIRSTLHVGVVFGKPESIAKIPIVGQSVAAIMQTTARRDQGCVLRQHYEGYDLRIWVWLASNF